MTPRRSLAAVLLRRLPRRGDDRGSMVLAFLVIIIAGGLGAMMLPALITQDRSTRFDISRVRALHAAQTGIDVVVGQFRAAQLTDSNGKTWGDDGDLPCYTSAAPMLGDGNGSGGESQYSVSVEYYLSDPALPSPTKMSVCAPGYGPYDSASGSRTPRYARITSTGTDSEGGHDHSNGRTIITTYVFQTDDTNISGGVIRIFPDASGNQWCWDAGAAVPAVNTQLKLRACSTSNPPLAQQVFAYRSDLSIQLVSSITTANPNGLCVDTATTPHAANVGVVLKKCTVADPAKCASITNCSPWNQQWSVDDSAHLEGGKSDRSDPNASYLDGYCIDAAAQADGTLIKLQSCSGSVSDTKETWVPSPTAGAGMAGPTNDQLVNYKQFATCLDVTGQDPNAANMILYTCKQDPNPAQVRWNQKFKPSPALGAGPTKVLLKTTCVNTGGCNGYANGSVFCLTSPQNTTGYVRLTTSGCPTNVATAAPQYVWTVSQVQDASGNELPYAEKYTIKAAGAKAADGRSLCLASGPNSDMWNSQYYKIVTLPCDGTTAQKWNANPSLDTSKLQNTHEIEVTGGS